MLLELKVKNLGIIEDITWQPGAGLNVITGETGAGKSLIIDAIEFLLSGKADEQAIRYGSNEAQIEGVFDLPKTPAYKAVRDLLAAQELDEDEDSLVISVRLRRNSPGIIRVNGRAVAKSVLRQIGRLLVDIHGQSEHLSLLDSKSHLNFLDFYGHTLELRQEFGLQAAALRKIEQAIAELEKNEKDRANRTAFLKFQLDEIDKAKLRDGEEEELEKERGILGSTEKLKELSYDTYRALYEEDGRGTSPALDKLSEAAEAMRKLVDLDPALKPQLKVVDDAVYTITDVARDVHAYGERLHFDPARLEEIESRVEFFRELKRKYGRTIADILNYKTKAEAELESVAHFGENLSRLNESRAAARQELGTLASRLSQARMEAALRLAADVKAELNDLNMPQVQFSVSIKQQPDPAGITLDIVPSPLRACPDLSGGESKIPYERNESGGKSLPRDPNTRHGGEGETKRINDSPELSSVAFTDDGADLVEFMVSTNPGEPAQPLARIASTGELSRFTLALKGALSEADSIPVLIFDEIDIGIGGRSGDIIGKKLWLLGRTHQVICVTHLPQIAAFADSHFGVRKTASGDRTLTVLETLAGDSRVRELAAMLSGSQFTDTSLQNAAELARGAEGWKKEAGK